MQGRQDGRRRDALAARIPVAQAQGIRPASPILARAMLIGRVGPHASGRGFADAAGRVVGDAATALAQMRALHGQANRGARSRCLPSEVKRSGSVGGTVQHLT
jgi:hypothetical protein